MVVSTKELNSVLNKMSSNYGLGYMRVKRLSICYGANPLSKRILLPKKATNFVLHKINQISHGAKLYDKRVGRLNFLWDARVYRGIRNKIGLPARGQRTKTNARTKKKFKF